MNYSEYLRNLVLFKTSTEEELNKIARKMTEKIYPKDSIIIEEGGTDLGLYIIKKGIVQIIKEGEIIGTLVSDDCFGEISLFDETPHSASVKSIDDSTLLIIKKEDFNELTSEDPKLALEIFKQMLRILAYRIRVVDEQLINIISWDKNQQQLK